MTDTKAPLTADFGRSFPNGTRDESTYEDVEFVLDRANAPAQGPGGAWLTLPQRVETLMKNIRQLERARAGLIAQRWGAHIHRAEITPGVAVQPAFSYCTQISNEINGTGEPPPGMKPVPYPE